MKRILIYGTGTCADYIFKTHFFDNEKVIGFIVSEKTMDIWNGIKVYSIDEVSEKEYDEIWLANRFFETIQNCIEHGIAKEKLIICNEVLFKEYYKHNDIVEIKYRKREAEQYENYIRGRSAKILTLTMDRYHVAPGTFINDQGALEHGDYFRYQMLALLIEEVKERNLSGCLAELGVYRADFSKWINAAFPSKRMYLFDTFESFHDTDIEKESVNDFTPRQLLDKYNDMFHNTSEEYVLSQMKYPKNCIIRKGYFPDTIPDEELSFSLVSLDCDLYMPTLEGLKYFYPRLERGGFIMVHDYNHEDHWLGVKEAVREYEQEIGSIIKIPIADNCGSLIISK